MQSSTGPGIGFSPRSQTATVFGQTFKTFANCRCVNPSANRICLNLLAVIKGDYIRNVAQVKLKNG
jgi:hypothetical protein